MARRKWSRFKAKRLYKDYQQAYVEGDYVTAKRINDELMRGCWWVAPTAMIGTTPIGVKLERLPECKTPSEINRELADAEQSRMRGDMLGSDVVERLNRLRETLKKLNKAKEFYSENVRGDIPKTKFYKYTEKDNTKLYWAIGIIAVVVGGVIVYHNVSKKNAKVSS